MKHLFFALVIALLSTPAATTAWSQQPTEQETKDFIVETLGKCQYVNEVKFEGSNLHLSSYADVTISGKIDGKRVIREAKRSYNFITPVQKLDKVEALSEFRDRRTWQSLFHVPSDNLSFTCKVIEGACMKDVDGKMSSAYPYACQDETNLVVAKAFNHLIKIYDAKSPERPKPLFE